LIADNRAINFFGHFQISMIINRQASYHNYNDNNYLN